MADAGGSYAAVGRVSFSGTPDFDLRQGSTQEITLTGDVQSSTLSHARQGEQINFIVCQDNRGGHKFHWPANVRGGMAVAPGASQCSTQSFIFDGETAFALSTGVRGM